MAKPLPEGKLKAIEHVLSAHPEGIPISIIEEELVYQVPRRTLQYQLHYLADQGRIVAEGERRGAKYKPAEADLKPLIVSESYERDDAPPPLSQRSREIREAVSQPLNSRRIVGYERIFLDSYLPNKTFYLTETDRARLHEMGEVPFHSMPAGTYARRIYDRLLIDLSWNSSRLEGNSYSLLETKKLLDFGKHAKGKDAVEAQMILNHKDAIAYLVSDADAIGFNRFTIFNLHILLSRNLMEDPDAEGRLRKIEVGIGKSSYMPIAVPQLIEECFDQILEKARAITDPFEQSFFVMVHLPYLQPFEDVNKRVSRLAANISLIRANLIPLSFLKVPRDLYTQAVLGVYELNRVELLKDLYIWAYERSVNKYAVIRNRLGEPDPFQFKYRGAICEVVGTIIRSKSSREDALSYLESWSESNISEEENNRFVEWVADELRRIHEGNFARFKVRHSDYEAWIKIWGATDP